MPRHKGQLRAAVTRHLRCHTARASAVRLQILLFLQPFKMRSSKETISENLAGKDINSLFCHYALPAIVASAASSLYNIIDRAFIGNGVGPLAIAGLALAFPVMNLTVAFGTLVGAGASSIVSIRLGERSHALAAATLGNCLMLNLAIGLFFSLLFLVFIDPILDLFGASPDTLPYARDFLQVILAGNVVSHVFFGLNNIMRASGHPTKAMVSILLTIGVNLLLAPVFIFIFKWGIRGAALATVLSQCCGLIWVIAHFFCKTSTLRFQKQGFRISGRIVKDIFAIGLSPFILHCSTCIIVILINLQLKRYGDLELAGCLLDGKSVAGGDLTVGAFGIINSIAGFMTMVLFGMAQGMQPIVGYNYGAGQNGRVRKALRTAVLCATATAAVCELVCLCCPNAIARIFTEDQQIVAVTAKGLRIYMSMFLFVGFQVVASTFYQAINKAHVSIFLSMTRQLFCLVPCLIVFPVIFGIRGVWLSQAVSDLASALIAAAVLLHHLCRRKQPSVRQ